MIAPMHRTLLTGIVTIAGAAVLVLEILGARLLAPDFGGTIHLWSAQITVTLAALAVGYAIGGRRADAPAPRRDMAVALFAAAGWIALVPLLTRFSPSLAKSFGFRVGPFAASALLFAIPGAFLGMMSPLAIRLAAHDRSVGRAVGDLFAASTAGSIGGALATTFGLLPYVPLSGVLWGTAAVLAACGAATLGFRASALPLALALGLPCLARLALPPPADPTLLHIEQSLYNDIRVVENRSGVRSLLLNRWKQGEQDAKGRPRQRYLKFLASARTVRPDAKRLLELGLGTGAVPKLVAAQEPRWERIAAVEIDAAVARVARESFGLPAGVEVVIDDGRRYLAATPDLWDAIVIDAYANGAVPPHLVTREFFRLLASRLAPGGVVLAQFHGNADGPTSRLWRAVWRTAGQAFRYRWHEEHGGSVHRVFVMFSNEPLPSCPAVDESDVPLLTDDYAPTDDLAAPLLAETYTLWKKTRR